LGLVWGHDGYAWVPGKTLVDNLYAAFAIDAVPI
jgi:hypothetical protein